jgi:hypothetical protein
MKDRRLILLGLVAALSITCGCGGKTLCVWSETTLDYYRGRSYETAKYNQIVNLEAGRNLEPVDGLNGQAGAAAVNKYRKSFEKKAEQQSYTLNIGSMGGIGKK